jgi:hypothetical protein
MKTTMDLNRTQIMNFWYEFDKFFLSQEMQMVMGPLSPYGKLRNSFLYHYDKGSLETGFRSEHENIKDSIKLLADNQVRIMDRHFGGNTALEQMAFELFAQGVLFDNSLDERGHPRRREGEKIHMMDSSITGYIVWHAFVRTVVLLYADGTIDSTKWLQTDRHIGLAAGILTELIKSGREPIQRNEPDHNKPIDTAVLGKLRGGWLNLSFPEIDDRLVQLRLDTVSEHTGLRR